MYVLSNAAHRAGEMEWDDRALAQLLKVGSDFAEYPLLVGKCHLNREEYDGAIGELEAAARTSQKKEAAVPSPELMQDTQ
ncbi:MAG TPA: hypothetical protein VMS18_10685 [Candidatus Binatia bacterium]|nr:hypothetical protein [Candidatus Binatia bacterium]